jgi:hypothetical protein
MDFIPVTIDFKIEDGKLIPINPINEIKHKSFLNTLKDGDKIHLTYEPIGDDGSYAQLAKVHKCIRTLASDTGDTFDHMKQQIKKRSGLCISINHENTKVDYYKSFGDCSKEELSGAIQSALELGDFLGINLH